jgi:allophanate hydrolase
MSVEIVSVGPMLSIQDAGRFGLRHLGVSAAGPVDGAAMALANVLCGNVPGAAALEFAGPGGSFRTKCALRFAVTGGPCDIRIDGLRVMAGESHRLNPGETLSVGVPQGVVWGYIAFSGGIASPVVLESRSTHLRSGLGGIDGRTLRAGDILPLGPDEADGPCLRPARLMQGAALPSGVGPIRLILGPQQDYFAPEIIARLTEEDFTVTPQRDRMAMVLGGVELPAMRGHDIVSDGTVPGSVQVPGSGLPLVLLAESQTTGGYPKIATVASADLARLAQMPVGNMVRFALITRDEGEEIWLAHQRAMRTLLGDLVAKPEGALSSEYLLSCNLIGGIFAHEEIVPEEIVSAEWPQIGRLR